jgi:uncharacterized protein (TIGR03435 family)
MLRVAFRIRPDQITGIPGWLESQHFDMQAKAEKPSSADELHVMLVNLLIERMHLKYHSEKRNMQMYALRIAKDGPRNLVRRASSAGTLRSFPAGSTYRRRCRGSTHAWISLLFV